MGQRCHGAVTVALCLVCLREVTRCFLTSSPSPGLRRRDHALHWLVATGFAPAAEAFEGDAACIREAARMQTLQDPVLAPSLLRLAFHDAATRRQGDSRRQGPNGSIRFELMRDENYGPSMAAALAAVENIVQRCRVSWADAIAVSGAAVVEAMGGPVISVETGRSDATEPDADKRLPDGTLTSGAIRDYFRQLGMSDAELVALLGAHTVGRWTSLLDVRPDCLDKEGRAFWTCSREQGRRLPFTESPAAFNNEYFREVLLWEQRQKMPKPKTRYKERAESEKSSPLNLLPSDIGMLFDPGLHSQVEKFAADEAAFFAAFASAYRFTMRDRHRQAPASSLNVPLGSAFRRSVGSEGGFTPGASSSAAGLLMQAEDGSLLTTETEAVPSSFLRPCGSSPGAAAASLNPRVFGRREAERNAQASCDRSTTVSIKLAECHHTLRLCNGQAKDLRAQFYQGTRGALVADALAYGSCTEFHVPTCLSDEMRMEFFELDAGGQENWLAASVFGRGMPAQRAILQQVAHDNYFAAFGVPREWLPRILVFASHAWVSGYVLELRTDQNQKIDLRHGDSVQLRSSKSYEVVLTPRERGGQKPCREAALDFLARPGQLHSVMYFRGEATGKEGLFLYPGDAGDAGSAEAADPAPWRDCEDMSPAILESPWPRDHRNAQMGDRGLVLTNLFHLLDQDRNLLLDTSEQAQLLRHAPAELAGNIRRWERRWRRESDAAGNINFSMFLAAVEHTQALSLGKVLRRLRLEGEAHPAPQKPRPAWWGLGTSWGAPEGPNPACWSEALRYADCCDDKSNTTCWTQDYDWELCCAEPEPWQIWETPPPPEQPGGPNGADKAPLSQLMLEAGSDKAQNGYCPIYEVLLQPLKVQRLLEVGLGTQNPDSLSSMAGLGPGFRPGGSLRAWRDYLPQAFIYGLDVMPDAMVRGEARIRSALADSANEGHVASVMKSWGFASAPGPGTPRGVFDVMVDDGLHSPEAQIATLGSLWPWLKRGGIFVIEDINDGKPMLQRASAAIEGIVGKALWL
ncbi:APX3 [Symbiodinium sp. CCMP2592]|nr:APX3 [Symbiodinium sp. CCMP2592]